MGGTLDAIFLGNMLNGVTGKGIIRAVDGVIWAGDGTIRSDENFWFHLTFKHMIH